MIEKMNEARFVMFRSSTSTWETIFANAAEHATSLGPGRVISISHSCDNQDSVVTVWYWADINEPLGERVIRC